MRYPYNWPYGWSVKKAPDRNYVSNYQVTGPQQQIFVRRNGRWAWSAFDQKGAQIMPNYGELETLLGDLVVTFRDTPTGAAP